MPSIIPIKGNVTKDTETKIQQVQTNRTDQRLSDKEKIFILEEKKSRKEGKNIIDQQSEYIYVILSDNDYYWKDVGDIDHIVGPKDTDIVNTVYTDQIKKYIADLLIHNPKNEDYQSRYRMLKEYESISDVLNTPYIQDRDNFDETVYTEPVEDIADFVETIQEELTETEKSRNDIYNDYRSSIQQETEYKHTIQALTKDIKDNKLLEKESIQQRQTLHKQYQQTLTTIENVTKKISIYDKELSTLQHILQRFSHKLDLLFNNETRTTDKQKVQARINKNITGGITQFLDMTAYISKQIGIYKQRSGGLQGIITQSHQKLEKYKKELIDLYLPAQEFFAIVKNTEKDIAVNKEKRQTIDTTLTKNKQAYEETKQAKDTFLFLYDEARFLKNIARNRYHYNNNTKEIQQIVKHPSVNTDTKELYNKLRKLLVSAGILSTSGNDLSKNMDACSTSIQNLVENILRDNKTNDQFIELLSDIKDILSNKKANSLQDIAQQCKNMNNNAYKNSKTKDYNNLYKKINKLLDYYTDYDNHDAMAKKNKQEITAIISNIQADHHTRLEDHGNNFWELGKYFSCIEDNNATIATLQSYSSAERKKHNIPRNQDNERTQRHKDQIDEITKENKEHNKHIETIIQDTWTAYESSKQQLHTIDDTINSQEIVKVSTERRIVDLLENPNHTIISQDIASLEKNLSVIKEDLDHTTMQIKEQQLAVEDKSDERYQSLIRLEQITQDIKTHYQKIDAIIGVLERYLPGPGKKMTDTDRDIREKRDVLIENRTQLISSAKQFKIMIETAMNTNKELKKDNVVLNMQYSIDGFLEKIG